jgi:hypothetical protein
MTEQQFLQEKYRSMVLMESIPKVLIEQFYTYEPPAIKTYINENQI